MFAAMRRALFWSGDCDSTGLPLPAPTKQTQCAESGGEERESDGDATRHDKPFVVPGVT
jgi:hypothetical protein